ncbi:protein tyrosine phosphatase [Cedecea neteri]|uniref:Protein tyrosine phosphatase n=1 Tax=Cedecea neteri TaxID=158822 RepID=A0A089Q2W5_9ENTR|nr:tyrosine-protein phosphatase [Cedecea neteri]AIR06638.1 protein tyrosine phosphatase [Cedecea neteri]
MNTQMQFSVSRKNQTQIEIHFSAVEGPIALYWTRDNDVNTSARRLITGHAVSPCQFDDPLNASQRIYFVIECNGQSQLFAERTLPVSGLNNFRDFGGYTGAGGKRIKWGMLYRSNHLHQLNAQAEAYIQSLNIQTIIDYRSAREIAKSPNTYVGEKQTVHLDAVAQTAELAAQFSADSSHEDQMLIESVIQDIPTELVNGHGEQVLEQYRNFVTSEKSRHAFTAMIRTVLDKENSPHIQHCRGGKDRTGYGVALILFMLGVSEEDVIADYMLTQANRLERNEVKMAAYRRITDDDNVLDYLHTLIDTREAFIIAAINAMKAQSGSVTGYIKEALGFTDADFVTIQNNFLTDPL